MLNNKIIPYTKDLVILANSKKMNGHCIAGKEIESRKWVRVVPQNDERAFSNWSLHKCFGILKGPNILDIVRIQFSHKDSLDYHPEDEYVTDNIPWVKIGELTKEKEIDRYVDDDEDDWFHKIAYSRDRIHQSFFVNNKLNTSLRMIKINENNNAELYYNLKFDSTNYRPCLRFDYKGVNYDLKVTDVVYPQSITNMPESRKLKDGYIIIGLGEEFLGNHYKLIVGIIELE